MDHAGRNAPVGVLWYASQARWVSDEFTAAHVDMLLASRQFDFILLKGGTGMGKTTAVARALAAIEYLMVATHRISLVEQNAAKFHCTAYNERKGADARKALLTGAARVATTLQSLPHAMGRDFRRDVLVIDEIEQAIRSIVSGKAGEGQERDARVRMKRWEALKHAMREARLTIALDAYATVETIQMLCRETGIRPERVCMIEFQHRPPRGQAVRMSTRDGLLEACRTAVQAPVAGAVHGKQQGALFLACSTLKQAEVYDELLREDGHRVLLWTALTKNRADVIAWRNNPQSVAHGTVYDAVVASPAISTGLSLDKIEWVVEAGNPQLNEERMEVLVEEGEGALSWPMFRTVAYDGKLHAFHMDDALQAIARVRECGRLLYWMPNRNDPEPPSALELAERMVERYAHTLEGAAHGRDPGTSWPQVRSIARASAHFEVVRRASVRYGGNDLSRRLRAEGWEVEEIESDSVSSDLDDVAAENLEARVQAMLVAPFAPAVDAPSTEWQSYMKNTTGPQREHAKTAQHYQGLLGIRGAHRRDNALSSDLEAVRWLASEGPRGERALRIGIRAARMAADEAIAADVFELVSDASPYSPTDASHHMQAYRLAIDGLHRARIDPKDPWTQFIDGSSLGDWARWTVGVRHELNALLDVNACTARRTGDRPRSFRAFCRRVGYEVVRVSRGRRGLSTMYRVRFHPVVRRALERRGVHVPEDGW